MFNRKGNVNDHFEIGTQMPKVTRPQVENLDDIRPRAPLILPLEDVTQGIRDIARQFGERKLPEGAPAVYQKILDNCNQGIQDAARAFVEMVEGATALMDDVIARCAAHDKFVSREVNIAKKLTEKYANLRSDLANELDAEDEEGEGK